MLDADRRAVGNAIEMLKSKAKPRVRPDQNVYVDENGEVWVEDESIGNVCDLIYCRNVD